MVITTFHVFLPLPMRRLGDVFANLKTNTNANAPQTILSANGRKTNEQENEDKSKRKMGFSLRKQSICHQQRNRIAK